MKAIVLVNAYIRQAGMIRQAERIAEELHRRGVEVKIEKNGNFLCSVSKNEIALSEDFDFCVYLDKDKYLPRMLEKKGKRLFNCAEGVELCDDKMLTAIALAQKGLNLPDTLPAPLCYYKDAVVSEQALSEIGRRLGFPLIAKKSYGSWGMDVRLIQNKEELVSVAEEFRMQPHLFQKFAGKRGEDYRVLVVGGRAIAGMKRKNEGDFRSNIEAGGKGYKAELSEEFLRAAERCAQILRLDYCGVDLLDEGGVPYVCEVNSNALFNEAERVTGVNIAGTYAEYMVQVMQKEEKLCADSE